MEFYCKDTERAKTREEGEVWSILGNPEELEREMWTTETNQMEERLFRMLMN